MSELRDECGVAAIYFLPGKGDHSPVGDHNPDGISRLMPRMLLDIQNRGQLAAGMTTFKLRRPQLLDTYKDVGTVAEVFRMNHRAKYDSLMRAHAGRAAIGHVRYATCGPDDRTHAQPFERHHIRKHKWFSFAFNGQLANYAELKQEVLDDDDTHLVREGDTEVFMHQICKALSHDRPPRLVEAFQQVATKLDGAYSLVFLDALGQMVVARDPLGIKPLCYAIEGPLFAAASESVALMNIGFALESIKSVPPGHAIIISDGQLTIERFATSPRSAHCFFEWVYFANVASTLDGRSVYLARKALGEELAELEPRPIPPDTVVVPVPDTSKAAADAMAYALKVPSVEGLIRNRYTGRTFIEGSGERQRKAQTKYTPLREVLEGKRVLLVEDSIVRATTLKVLLQRVREVGRPKEIHVRVACPPIISTCCYGIDMSTITELFAPPYLEDGRLTPAAEAKMAARLEADSLRYLPVEAVARAIGFDAGSLCQGCITGKYPTPCGQTQARVAVENDRNHIIGRSYETAGCARQLLLGRQEG